MLLPLLSTEIYLVHFGIKTKLYIVDYMCSCLDSNLQPKFYCVLSPEASEDDRSRLDSKVKPNIMHAQFAAQNNLLQFI